MAVHTRGGRTAFFARWHNMGGPPQNCKKKVSCNQVRRTNERTAELRFFIAILVFASLTYAQTISQPSTAAHKQANPGAKQEAGYDPLLDLPLLPNGETTVVGGTISKIDPITDRLQLRYFGGGKIDISFDPRTKILSNGSPATAKDIHPGNQVYVDTMLKGDQVFARSIRMQTARQEGDARGQVVAVDPGRGMLWLREEVAPQIFRFRLGPQTTVTIAGQITKASEMLPGALVSIRFAGGGADSLAHDIRVLANPGEKFTFVGEITYLDVHVRRMAIANQSDKENYDITLDKIAEAQLNVMKIGSHVVLTAIFNGKNYEAQGIDIAASHNQAEK